MSKCNFFALSLSCLAIAAQAQGTFQNLDFENPVLPLVPGSVSITAALPGWTGYNTTEIYYDSIALGAAAISLHDTNGFIPIVQGNYTAYLQSSFPGGAVVPAIGQVGTVPTTARSVMFYGGGYTVSFAGQQLPVATIGSGPNYTIFGVDISVFAGQAGELRFQGGGLLDNIFFSSQSIPEPTPFGLFAAGAIMLGLTRTKRRGPRR